MLRNLVSDGLLKFYIGVRYMGYSKGQKDMFMLLIDAKRALDKAKKRYESALRIF